ncbi:MAG: ATP-binding cassette domain-containing protein [Myxococcales bacterium]|nr:ATP-binding cassette domain-containing protein [Myxococcales bacterium]
MIRVEGLFRWYGPVRAVAGIDFSIGPGEVVGFLGPNGAGKTTTLKTLTGGLAPSTGRAFIADLPVDGSRGDFRKHLGYLPENAPAWPEMRVRDYLRFAARVRGVARVKRSAAIEAVMARCGLQDMAGRELRTLSKGYRQRVGLAQALVHDPPILILDEPTSGLDPNQVQAVRALIRELGRTKTILFSSHLLAEVQAVATRVLILNQGRLVADGTPDALGLAVGGGRLRLVVGGDAAALPARLQALDGVIGVASEAEAGAFAVTMAPGAEVRAAVARAVVAAGLDLLELRPARADLEAVFRRLTEAAQ